MNVRLVTIDPLASYLGGNESYRNADVRALLDPLARLASELDFALLLVSHLRKGEGRAIYRAMGSLAFTAVARSVWLAVKDSSFPSRRFFVPIKNNTGDDETGFAYTIDNSEGCARLAWEPEPLKDQADVLLEKLAARPAAAATQTTAISATEALKELLEDGPRPASDVVAEAFERWGIKSRMLYYAKKELGLLSTRDGHGGSAIWHLPPLAPEDGEEDAWSDGQ